MEMPHALPRSEVKDLLQAIIQKREEKKKCKGDEYKKKDAELDALLELLAQRFMSAPTRGTERFPETLPPAEEEDEIYPSSESHFDPARELRNAVPSSVNETPADLDTTPSIGETAEQIRQREELDRIYAGGKISAYSMKSTLYNRFKKAPSTLFNSFSSVSKMAVKPFTKGMKSKKTKKNKKYRK
jgi:hypothetical protein